MEFLWPEPVQRVQHLAESGLKCVPAQYVRPAADRPHLMIDASGAAHAARREGFQTQRLSSYEGTSLESIGVPVLDLADWMSGGERSMAFLRQLKRACEEWGFLQLINHGMSEAELDRVREAARGFFHLPIQEKQAYANDPVSYQGYGSRLGSTKGAILDWGDYFFLNILPVASRDMTKWPTNPHSWRSVMEDYCKKIAELSRKLLEALSISLDLTAASTLQEAFGEVDMGLRINFYPPCPQPELTLGLSSHSDPGGIALLLQDPKVGGLQVKPPSSLEWINVPVIPGALLVNIGDQVQILTNGRYKSVEHRVVTNNNCERLSLVCFINPGNNTVVSPLPELVPRNELPAYNAMTFKQYRSFIRRMGTNGKGHINSIASPTSLTPKSQA
ncbi:hypothetical protein KP509_25G041200 [Ceratopteris richardii]|uniref:Fe2OG dioxygenase domain-containing protein n=1 Tax=Ceratopteris richardii TaxID=49495 RepID=A0A8T2RS60_CERRI|nr:hypothetical protein KP509_25G041200 [Ceratopteris richardii]